MSKTRVFVIVPTRNERATISEIIASLLAQQENLPNFDLNILVVDGFSTDGTLEFVSGLLHEEPRIHLLSVPEPGLGVALRHAHLYAFNELHADAVAQIDADLSHDPAQLPDILRPLQAGYDLTLGSRYIRGGGSRRWPFVRKVTSFTANHLIRLFTGHLDVHDWTSGYRAFTADLYRRIDASWFSYSDYTLQPALVYEAVLAGARVKEIPIIFEDRRWGKSKLPTFGYSYNLVRHFLRARLRRAPRIPAPLAERLPGRSSPSAPSNP